MRKIEEPGWGDIPDVLVTVLNYAQLASVLSPTQHTTNPDSPLVSKLRKINLATRAHVRNNVQAMLP
jgi:hypothetical protein